MNHWTPSRTCKIACFIHHFLTVHGNSSTLRKLFLLISFYTSMWTASKLTNSMNCISSFKFDFRNLYPSHIFNYHLPFKNSLCWVVYGRSALSIYPVIVRNFHLLSQFLYVNFLKSLESGILVIFLVQQKKYFQSL